jgi:hypothetical protein
MLRLSPFRALVVGLLAAIALLLVAFLWRLQTPPPPDPRLIDVSVRSTIFALPTQTAWVVEVTRVVEVTATPMPRPLTATPTMAPSATPAPSPGANASPEPAAANAAAIAYEDRQVAPAVEAVEIALLPVEPAAPVEPVAPAGPAPPPPGCPTTSNRGYDAIPVDSLPIDHPDAIHGDLNLWQRGWAPTDALLALIDINGPADGDPPQLAGIFADGRLPGFVRTAQVHDWNWGCGGHGCRGELLTQRAVTLLGMATTPGESLAIPRRGAEIYGGGYKALVLYADDGRVTLGFTREDSVANGYAVHLEGLCVDTNLLALYRQRNAEGRGALPALRDGEVLGSAASSLLVAVRDRGVFLDPRSRKDWWRGF